MFLQPMKDEEYSGNLFVFFSIYLMTYNKTHHPKLKEIVHPNVIINY